MGRTNSGGLEDSAGFAFVAPTTGDSIKIAHLSDLHFGWGFDTTAWEHVCSRLEDWKPHVIVISGDFVNNPWPRALLEAKIKIVNLKKQCANGPILVVVPGNHDVGLSGNVPIWFLSKLFFCIFDDDFDNNLLEQYKALHQRESHCRNFLHVYWTVLTWYMRRRLRATKEARAFPKFPAINGHLWLATINSNQSSPRRGFGKLIPRFPRLATGFVRDDQIEQLVRQIESAKSNYWAALVRVVIMHHHPLPLSYSDQHEGVTSYEPFLALRNAGTVLRAFIDGGIDLVLHGHKHLQHFGRVDFDNGQGESNPLAVIAAGSAGVAMKGAGLNSMNLICVEPHGRILVDTVRFGGGQYSAQTERVYEEDFAHVKRRNWRRALEAHALRAERYEASHKIDEDGTSHTSHEVKKFCALGGRKVDTRFRWVNVPRYGSLREDRVHVLEPYRASGLRVEGCARADDGYRYTLRLPHPADERNSVDWGVGYETRNCFCLSRWEAERRGRPPQENVALFVTYPCRRLSLRMELPSSLRHRGLKLRCERPRTYPHLDFDAESGEVRPPRQISPLEDSVADGLQEAPAPYQLEAFIKDDDITTHEQPALTMLDVNIWQLEIARPLVGYKYVVYWELPDERAPDGIGHGTKKCHDALFAYRTRLMNHALREADKKCRKEVDMLFQGLYAKFAARERDERFAVSLMSFDANSNQLFIVDIMQKPEAVRPWEFRLGLGEGLSGAAFKVRRLLIGGLDPDGNAVGDIFVPPPGTELKAMISVPAFHPDVRTDGRLTPDAVIGVLSFGSTSTTSPIGQIVSMSRDSEQKQLLEEQLVGVRSVVQGTVERMLDTLGSYPGGDKSVRRMVEPEGTFSS